MHSSSMEDGVQNSRETGWRAKCCTKKLPPWRVILTIVACFFVEVTLGITYANGNLMPYLVSYLRYVAQDEDLDYSRTLWINGSLFLTVSLTSCFAGLLEPRTPRRLYFFVGIVFNSSALFGAYWAVQKSFVATVLVYGVIQGLGQSVLYPLCLNISGQWFKQNRGLVGGLVIAGYGGGAFVWNQVTTQWINPDNIQPDLRMDGNMYFTQTSVLHKVPSCFLLLGGIITLVQLACLLSITYAPSHSEGSEDDQKADHKAGDKSDVLERSVGITPSSKKSKRLDVLRLKRKIAGLKVVVEEKDEEKEEAVDGGLAVSASQQDCGEEKDGKGCVTSEELEDHQPASKRLLPLNDAACDSSTPPPAVGKTTRIKPRDLTVVQILKSRATWTMCLASMFWDMPFIFVPAFYKAYGQTFISNDHFLSLVASFASAFNAAGRPVWGLLSDRIGYLPCALANQAVMAVMASTLFLSEMAGSSAVFAVWVFGMFVAFSGLFAMQVPLVFSLFGYRYFVFAYTLTTVAPCVISTFACIAISSTVFDVVGWSGIFFVSSGGAFMSMVSLGSLLLSCGHPIPSHMRAGILKPRRITPGSP